MKKISRQTGQATIEAILLITLLLGFAITITKAFQDGKFLSAIVEGPWDYLAGMTESGVWKKSAEARPLHPNQFARHATRDGDH